MTKPLLSIDDLNLSMSSFDGVAHVLKGVDLTIRRGEIWGLVGESGSGKSLTGMSVSRLLRSPPARYLKGRIDFEGQDMLQLPMKAVQRLRGKKIGMVFQDPMTNLNPTSRIGDQLVDVALAAADGDATILECPPDAGKAERKRAARTLALRMLERVGIPNAAERMDAYPHQFSGGMRQRVLIAMALIGRPDLLIADEPTTALDVSVQAQILKLLKGMVADYDIGVMLITHNLGVVAQTCTHVAVMYQGAIVESGTVNEVIGHPTHAYTKALMAAIPTKESTRGSLTWYGRTQDDGPRAALAQPAAEAHAATSSYQGPILQIEDVSKIYGAKRTLFGKTSEVQALKDVSITVQRGESFGLVGESGSGKTTLTRSILNLETPTAGRILIDGQDLAQMPPAELRRLRARVQIVFQDPYASLNPRMTVRDIITEPMRIHHDILQLSSRQRTERAAELLTLVGLSTQHLTRHPHEFSGGQRQRICIARALASGPDLLLLDEPTSALDVSVQAQVLNLLCDLQDRLGLTYFFISHDLAVVRYLCDRVALIYRGELVEEGETDQIFDAPKSEYARMLIGAMPEVKVRQAG